MPIPQLSLPTDPQGRQANLYNPCIGGCHKYDLTANTAKTLTIPSGAGFVYFSANVDFYSEANAAASIVAGDVTDGSASELNPMGYALDGVTSLSVISPYNGTITASFYSRWA